MLSNKVREIMTADVFNAESSHTIFEVMEMMVAKDVGRIVITERENPVGIFTEKDVLKRVMNRRLDPKKGNVKSVMTSRIQAVSQETNIIEALGRMYKGKFRHLLVRGDKGKIAGMVSMRRILKIAVELGRGLTETQTVGSIMSPHFVTIEALHSVREAIETMVKADTVCVVVLRHGQPAGIFTERDVLKRVAVKDIDTQRTSVEEVMTANLVVAPQSALIGAVLDEMYKGDFRNMPIVGRRGELVGVVSMPDVLQFAIALDIDEGVRKAWREIEEFWDSEDQYTPG